MARQEIPSARFHLSWLAAALVAVVGSAAEAAQLQIPDCSALAAWGARTTSPEQFNIAPRFPMPKAFQDADFVPVFGAPVIAWTMPDVQAAGQALQKCFQEAGARRDQAAANALANANRAIQGLVPRLIATLQKARADADTAKKQLDALPDSPELGRALEALVKGNPAAPDGNQYRTLPREIGDPAWRLANANMLLPDPDRAALAQALGARSTAMQAGLASGTEKLIAEAPADAGGLVALIEARQRLAGLSDADARARLSKAADDRMQTIRDGLRHASPAVFVPPSCLELYRWAAAPGAASAVGVGGRGVWAAFLDDRAVPVFGIPTAQWSDQDVARLKSLRAVCQAAAQPQPGAAASPDPAAAELAQIARNGHWIDAADQQIADARSALVAYDKLRQALDADLAKIQALPDAMQSLIPLAQMASDPALGGLTPGDRTRLTSAIDAKRAAIGAHASAAAIAGLADVKLASVGDFPKLFAYVSQASQTIPDQRGQQAFREAANHTLDEAAQRLLPDFSAQLAALPADLDGAAQAGQAVGKLTGVPPEAAARLPAFKPYFDAAAARREAIVKGVHDQACEALLSAASVGGDAGQMVWDGDKGVTLGAFICGLAEHGYKIDGYAGAGYFSSTSTLKVTPLKEAIEIISLHKAEVKQGQPMLVGFKIVDANGQQISVLGAIGDPNGNAALSVDGWEFYAKAAVLQGVNEPEGCKAIIAQPVAKPGPADQLFALHCAAKRS
jgi:hypothetical protein